MLAAPGLPISHCCNDHTIYVAPGIEAPQLAKALWFFLRAVGGFRGDDAEMEAAILPIAERRAARLRREGGAS